MICTEHCCLATTHDVTCDVIQDCAEGFRRSGGGLYLGTCEGCDCFGHATECDPLTGACVVSPLHPRAQSLLREARTSPHPLGGLWVQYITSLLKDTTPEPGVPRPNDAPLTGACVESPSPFGPCRPMTALSHDSLTSPTLRVMFHWEFSLLVERNDDSMDGMPPSPVYISAQGNAQAIRLQRPNDASVPRGQRLCTLPSDVPRPHSHRMTSTSENAPCNK